MEKDRAGRTALINACIEADPALAEQLLEDGADPNTVDNDGWSALHFAAANSDGLLVRRLLEKGALMEIRDCYGNSPLWRAVMSYRGNGEAIIALLQADADPDAVNDHGVSPRSLALTISNYDVSRFFESQ
ncbi:ankyrin repeat domain-containing protein [Hephaestia mangrovi]|uniref:ankyrin repeat domain-containing protein n=1 Tax=Hephaestia mangrovi TaxID=2873268 RepID=UPI001CA75B2B|nr:ankyrin repeat domain-containing protein [Hephaestia mangrovi]MBY8826865.1 ankyrin repeat domain-containing protein [Hephaestia mangrovi]